MRINSTIGFRWLLLLFLLNAWLGALAGVRASEDGLNRGPNPNAGDNAEAEEQGDNDTVAYGIPSWWYGLVAAAAEDHPFLQASLQVPDTQNLDDPHAHDRSEGLDSSAAWSDQQHWSDDAVNALNYRMNQARQLAQDPQSAPSHWHSSAGEQQIPQQFPDSDFASASAFVAQEAARQAHAAAAPDNEAFSGIQGIEGPTGPWSRHTDMNPDDTFQNSNFDWNAPPQPHADTQSAQNLPSSSSSQIGVVHHLQPLQYQEPPPSIPPQHQHPVSNLVPSNAPPMSSLQDPQQHQFGYNELDPSMRPGHPIYLQEGYRPPQRRPRSPAWRTPSPHNRRPQKKMRMAPGPDHPMGLPYNGRQLNSRWRELGAGGWTTYSQGGNGGMNHQPMTPYTHMHNIMGQQHVHRPPLRPQVQLEEDRVQSLYQNQPGFGAPSSTGLEELRRLFRDINSGQELISRRYNEWIGPEEMQHRANFLASAVTLADEVILETIPLSHPLRQAILSGNQDLISARITEMLSQDEFAHIHSSDGENVSPADAGRQVQRWRDSRNEALATSSARSVALPPFGWTIRPDASGRYVLPGQEVRTLHPTLESNSNGSVYLHFVSPLVGNVVERLLGLFPPEFIREYRSFNDGNSATTPLGLGWISLATVLIRQALLRRLPGYGTAYWMMLSEAERNLAVASAVEEQFLFRTPILQWIFTETDEHYSIMGFLDFIRGRLLKATLATIHLSGRQDRYPQPYHPSGHTGFLRRFPGAFDYEETPDVRPGPSDAGPSQSRRRQAPVHVENSVEGEEHGSGGSRPKKRPRKGPRKAARAAQRAPTPPLNDKGKGKAAEEPANEGEGDEETDGEQER